jgi:hypothetical protein
MIEAEDLKHALAPFLGTVLSPETAAAIMLDALNGRDRAIDPAQFEPRPLLQGAYVAAVERFEDVLPELHPLHLRHFEETERYRAHQGLNPDYDALARDSRAGRLLQFTLREVETRALVGNIRFYLATSRHTAARYAREDTYFVLKEHRKGLMALDFWRYAERCMRTRLGVIEIRTDTKLTPGASIDVRDESGPAKGVHRLNERLGYAPVAIQYVKTFEGEDHVH